MGVFQRSTLDAPGCCSIRCPGAFRRADSSPQRTAPILPFPRQRPRFADRLRGSVAGLDLPMPGSPAAACAQHPSPPAVIASRISVIIRTKPPRADIRVRKAPALQYSAGSSPQSLCVFREDAPTAHHNRAGRPDGPTGGSGCGAMRRRRGPRVPRRCSPGRSPAARRDRTSPRERRP